MQLKNQNLDGKDWKVIAAVTTVGALGFSGLALAGTGEATTPSSIDLQDRIPVSSVTSQANDATGPSFTFPSVLFSMSADTTFDSPFDTMSPSQSMSPSMSVESTPSIDSSPSMDSTASIDSRSIDSSVSEDSPSSADSE